MEEDVTVEVTWVVLNLLRSRSRRVGWKKFALAVSLPAAHGGSYPEGLALPPCADSEVQRPLSDFAVSVPAFLKKYPLPSLR